MEKTFYDAAKEGKEAEVKDILRKNPSLNVNWRNEGDLAMGVSLFGGKKGGPTMEKKCLLSLSPSSLSPVMKLKGQGPVDDVLAPPKTSSTLLGSTPQLLFQQGREEGIFFRIFLQCF